GLDLPAGAAGCRHSENPSLTVTVTPIGCPPARVPDLGKPVDLRVPSGQALQQQREKETT
ncbi:MAG TPA: hypothetical protein PKZ19_18365, partial [Zoogloea sp.]|nr:hypothetical protein [Zoogloea sp.]